MSFDRRLLVVWMLALVIAWAVPALAEPPFQGTVFIDPDVITSADPTAFQAAVYVGRGVRTMFDRRVDAFVDYDAFLIEVSFDDGSRAEAAVNPEFGTPDAALAEADRYGRVIGRLPLALRKNVEKIWIHRGVQPFGGGNRSLLIHSEQGDVYAADGWLEEALAHEATHTSLDDPHAAAPGWLDAQVRDGEFISTYARDNPGREDVAESFLPYLAVRHRRDRISDELAGVINSTIPNRIAYFDALSLAMYPLEPLEGPLVCDADRPCPDDGNPCSVEECVEGTACTSTMLQGIAGATCLCPPAQVPACAGQPVPAKVGNAAAAACRAIAKAEERAFKPKRARAFLRKAANLWGTAGRLVAKVTRKPVTPLSEECAAALGASLEGARVQTTAATAAVH